MRELHHCAGLAFGFVFRGGRGQLVHDETLHQALEQGADWVWLHLGLSDHRARLLYEEGNTRIAAITNRSLSALTVISTLLLPPSFVAGAFGMNVGGVPLAQEREGFWLVLGFCLVLIAISYAVLRRFRILP